MKSMHVLLTLGHTNVLHRASRSTKETTLGQDIVKEAFGCHSEQKQQK